MQYQTDRGGHRCAHIHTHKQRQTSAHNAHIGRDMRAHIHTHRQRHTNAHTHAYVETDGCTHTRMRRDRSLKTNRFWLTAVLERRQYLPFVKRVSDRGRQRGWKAPVERQREGWRGRRRWRLLTRVQPSPLCFGCQADSQARTFAIDLLAPRTPPPPPPPPLHRCHQTQPPPPPLVRPRFGILKCICHRREIIPVAKLSSILRCLHYMDIQVHDSTFHNTLTWLPFSCSRQPEYCV